MHLTLRRSLAAAAVLALATVTAGCGSDTEPNTSAANAATDTVTDEVDGVEVAVDSIAGLEVTAVGNVSDILSDEALRLDRDGLGSAEDQGEVGVDDYADWDYDYDYDYYDYDYLTEYDDEFGDDDLADEGVLVVSESGLKDREVDEAVRVSGTIRRFDKDVLESLYDVNLSEDFFEDKEDTLVIVADSVRPASAPAATDGAGDGATATPSAGTS